MIGFITFEVKKDLCLAKTLLSFFIFFSAAKIYIFLKGSDRVILNVPSFIDWHVDCPKKFCDKD